MSRPEQVLQISPPQEIAFQGPFTEVVTSSLKLANPSDRAILFKIKTTAPKRYVVRPNGGTIDAGASVSVQIMLQPFDYEPNEKNKHKFMVQAIYLPEGVQQSALADQTDAVWSNAGGSEVMDTKLKCAFVMPANVSPAAADSRKEDPLSNRQATGTQSDQSESATHTGGVQQQVDSQAKQSGAGPAAAASGAAAASASENAALRSELQQVKEESLRLRRKMAEMQADPSVASTIGQMQQQQPAATAMVQPILYCVLAVIIGIVLGKYLIHVGSG